MKNAFYTIWKIVKPVNKIHANICFFALLLLVVNQLTLPPSKSKDDYVRVTGKLVEIRQWRGSWGGEVKTLNGNKVKFRIIPSSKGEEYRRWLKKNVAAYYWPGSLFARKKQLVFMAPLDQEPDLLNDFINTGKGFERTDIYLGNNVFIFGFFIFVWITPVLSKLVKTNST